MRNLRMFTLALALVGAPATASLARPANIAAAVAATEGRSPDNVKIESRNPADDHGLLVLNPQIRGKTDRFIDKSRKAQ